MAMIPRTSDGQLLFLLNNISKMKKDSPLGSRIAEVHNGSSLFTGDAGSGESNARRYLIENDYVEAIIALPLKMFYNTGLGTFIWVLSNKKAEKRKGKIQLIDATEIKSALDKNMGQKNCELTPELRKEIVRIFMEMEESEISKVFNNSDFGYWKVWILQPLLDEEGKPQKDKKGRIIPDKAKETLNKSSAAAGGSFAPTMQIEKLEIHKVFLRFSIFSLRQNPSPSALDDLIRASLRQKQS